MRDLIRWTSSLSRSLLHGVRVLMPILVGSKSERTSRSGTGTSISVTKCRHSNRSHSKFKLMKLHYKQVSCIYYASNRKNIPRVVRIKTPNLHNNAYNTTLPSLHDVNDTTDNYTTREGHLFHRLLLVDLFTINALGGEYQRWSENFYLSRVQDGSGIYKIRQPWVLVSVKGVGVRKFLNLKIQRRGVRKDIYKTCLFLILLVVVMLVLSPHPVYVTDAL